MTAEITEPWSPVNLGFIGAGQMGAAMMRGLLAAGLAAPQKLSFLDPDPKRRQELAALGLKAAANYAEVMQAEVVILAVKPQVVGEVLKALKDLALSRHLLISIVAGFPLAALEGTLSQARLIRVMPNTPLQVQAGMTAVAPGTRATPQDLQLTLTLFNALGRALLVEEKLFDAVTALSGSGPAYVALFLEALADGGVKMGLPRTLAMELAVQTLLGTAKLCQEKGLHPGILKDQVASPGGTTIAGLHALEQGGFRGLVMNAVEAAAWRAQDLAALSSK